MGFDPSRQTKKSGLDIAIVIGAFVVITLALAWTLFG